MGGEFPEPGRNPDTDPLNYGNFGFDIVGTEVHADGEIWVAVEIDLRDLFLQRYPSSGIAEDVACVRGQQDTNTCPGDRRWIQDYYDSMVIMPRATTMIQARDAMLAADMAPLRRGQPGPDLPGLRDARLRHCTRTRSATPTRTRFRTSRRRTPTTRR